MSQGEGRETWDSPAPSHTHTHTQHSILPRRVQATVWNNLFCNMTGHSLLIVILRSWKDPQWQCASHDRVLEPRSSLRTRHAYLCVKGMSTWVNSPSSRTIPKINFISTTLIYKVIFVVQSVNEETMWIYITNKQHKLKTWCITMLCSSFSTDPPWRWLGTIAKTLWVFSVYSLCCLLVINLFC